MLTTSTVVENRPFGHWVFSLTRTCPWPSLTIRATQGSGTHAPGDGAGLERGEGGGVVLGEDGHLTAAAVRTGEGEPLLLQPGAQGDVLGVPELGGRDASCP